MLLTTHAVDGLQAARSIVGWYRKRWLIEQLFRTLKTQGFNVEESQVVEAHALMNLVTAALIAAMQTLQLTLARDDTTRQPASDAFTAVEVRALAAVERKLPGRTCQAAQPASPTQPRLGRLDRRSTRRLDWLRQPKAAWPQDHAPRPHPVPGPRSRLAPAQTESVNPVARNGERVGVRGSGELQSRLLPLTLTLSP